MAIKKSSPWTIGIGTALFSFILTVIYDLVKDKPVLSSIWAILKWTGNLIWKILDFDIKVWWLFLFLVLIILIIYLLQKQGGDKGINNESYNYTQDRIKGIQWSWRWEFSTSQKSWILTDLKALCPQCNTPMFDQDISYQMNFECPRCDHHFSKPSNEKFKVGNIILDNINRQKNKNNP